MKRFVWVLGLTLLLAVSAGAGTSWATRHPINKHLFGEPDEILAAPGVDRTGGRTRVNVTPRRPVAVTHFGIPVWQQTPVNRVPAVSPVQRPLGQRIARWFRR